LWAWKQKEKARSAARQTVKEQGEETHSEADSSEEEDEGEVTPPPPSLPCITPPPFRDNAGQQVGITIGQCRPKQIRTNTKSTIGLPQQPQLVSVTSDSKGMSILLASTELTHMPGVPQVLLGSVATMVVLVES
jgi:hypothetical protein